MKGYSFEVVKNCNNIHTEFVINYKDGEVIDVTERRRQGTKDALNVWDFKNNTLKTRMQKNEVFKQLPIDESIKKRIIGGIL
jgi:hypothetical protein